MGHIVGGHQRLIDAMVSRAEALGVETLTEAPVKGLATADDGPPDEPPLVRSRFHGLRVWPYRTDSVVVVRPSSGDAVLPKITSPACL